VKKSEGVVMRGKNTKLSLSCAALLFLCMLACVVGVASAKTIYVPDDHERIQWAVDNASDGDTIIVRDGTYYENIVVNISYLTIKSENGSANCVVRAPSNHVFKITADYVNISGFTIVGFIEDFTVEGFAQDGIHLDSSTNCSITNNNIWGCLYGIWLDDSHYNKIMNNNIHENDANGITLYASSNNKIINNNIYGNDDGWGIEATSYLCTIIDSNKTEGLSDHNEIISNNIYKNVGGIHFDCSSNNKVTSNNIYSNNWLGIKLWGSSNNIITSNTFTNDGLCDFFGQNIIEDNSVNGKPLVYLKGESNKTITNAGQVILVNCNNITVVNLNLSNTDVGVELLNTNDCRIINNDISNNYWGIYLIRSSNNTIANNILNNNDEGLFLDESNNNIITNNNILNNKRVGIYSWYYKQHRIPQQLYKQHVQCYFSRLFKHMEFN